MRRGGGAATRAPGPISGRSVVAVVRMTGPRFDVLDVFLDAFVLVVMPNAVKAQLIVAARAAYTVAVGDPPDALAESGAAFRAAHPHLDVVDRVMHGGLPCAIVSRRN